MKNKDMGNLVVSLDGALASIVRFNEGLPDHFLLQGRLGRAHVFYVLEREEMHARRATLENLVPASHVLAQGDGELLFGPSKFVGYDGMTPEYYIDNSKSLDGRDTEHALDGWFEEVLPGSPGYEALFGELVEWMADYGMQPRKRVRIKVIRPEFRQAGRSESEDRRLLDLMIAAADILPLDQRHELRAAL